MVDRRKLKAFLAIALLAVLLVLFVGLRSANAQEVGSSTLNGMPVPAVAPPPSEIVGGLVGAGDRYAREDHTHPRISRAAVATTDASGNWSVTWATPTPVVSVILPIAVSAAAQPVSCNVVTRTVNGATGRCWLAQSSLLNLSIITAGLTLLPYGAASGVTVQVLAIPPTE